MPALINHSDIVDTRIGNLLVVSPSHTDGKHWWYNCLCDCGNEKKIRKVHLKIGKTTGCGCSQMVHGLCGSPEYSVWMDMKGRCRNPNNPSYHHYGGRGIKVCDRWLESNGKGLINFLEDLGKRLSNNYSLERKDVNGDYCPENCMWTDDNSLQAYNKRKLFSNTSGRVGVIWDEHISGTKKWRAQISYKSIIKRARFYTFDEAVSQRVAWEIEIYGFNVESHNDGGQP